MLSPRRMALVVLLSLSACAARSRLPLRKVVLYQNGIGYFERSGRLHGDRLQLRLRLHEVDDVLKTLTVIDRRGGELGASAELVQRKPGDPESDYDLRLAAPAGAELTVAYTAPMPSWRTVYRLVLDQDQPALLQAWAKIDNSSDEDWRKIRLTLATGAPFSFAVDLHTPQFPERPDVTGQLVPSGPGGAVRAERTRSSGETEADGADGSGRGSDRDQDRIPDAEDRCPGEPETYNGFEDEDGCPDKGRVIVTHSSLEILDKVYFAAKRRTINPKQRPILEAIVSTLKGNPQILLMEVQGHAAHGEGDPLGLSEARAQEVVRYLVGQGVAASRLIARGYAATQGVCKEESRSCLERNRRVEFLILRRQDAQQELASSRSPAPVRASDLERGLPALARPRDVAGVARYELEAPISVARGAAALVTILSRRLAAEEVYLFRPDPGVPGSESYPFRAARLKNAPDLTLEPGTVALYARGAFVGDALLDRLHPSETTFLPFALDSSTVVRRSVEGESRPVRIVTAARGVATLEDLAIRRTRYRVVAGKGAPRRIFLRHQQDEGYQTVGLPPAAEQSAEAHLIPIELRPGGEVSLVVEQRRTLRHELALLEGHDLDLSLYLADSELAPEQRTQLVAVVELRKALAVIERRLTDAQAQRDAVAERARELRETLDTIAKQRRAEPLRRELTGRLAEAVRKGEEHAQRIAELLTEQVGRRAGLELAVSAIQVGLERPAP